MGQDVEEETGDASAAAVIERASVYELRGPGSVLVMVPMAVSPTSMLAALAMATGKALALAPVEDSPVLRRHKTRVVTDATGKES